MVIFIAWIVLIPLEQKSNLNLRKKYIKNFCNVVMSSKETKILEFNRYQKSDKAGFIIYADLEFLI